MTVLSVFSRGLKNAWVPSMAFFFLCTVGHFYLNLSLSHPFSHSHSLETVWDNPEVSTGKACSPVRRFGLYPQLCFSTLVKEMGSFASCGGIPFAAQA